MALAGSHVPHTPLHDEASAIYGDRALQSFFLWASEPSGTRSIVHWRTSYLFQESVGNILGISVDMTMPTTHIYTPPSERNFKGCATITARGKKIMTTGPSFTYPVCFDRGITVTVADIANLIRARNFQHYMFSERGSGCLHWQIRLLRAFAESGWITPSKPDKILAEIEKDWAKLKQKSWQVIVPPVEGTDYNPAEFEAAHA